MFRKKKYWMYQRAENKGRKANARWVQKKGCEYRDKETVLQSERKEREIEKAGASRGKCRRGGREI